MVSQAHGVYLGSQVLRTGQVQVYPLHDFLKHLWAGNVLGGATAG